jgi:hypothetical protein
MHGKILRLKHKEPDADGDRTFAISEVIECRGPSLPQGAGVASGSASTVKDVQLTNWQLGAILMALEFNGALLKRPKQKLIELLLKSETVTVRLQDRTAA